MANTQDRLTKALDIAMRFGGIDGEHHKTWVIDQMVRALTGCPEVEQKFISAAGLSYACTVQDESPEYLEWVVAYKDGEDGPDTYEWDEGIAP